MGFNVLHAVSICVVTWIIWKLLQRFTTKKPLDNVRGPPSPSYLLGHFKMLRDQQGWAFHREIAETYGPVARLRGILGGTVLFVQDPKALHHISVKDQEIWEEHAYFLSVTGRVFGPGLLATTGETHRRQRKMLNPVFHTNHMRRMMPIFYGVVHRLREAIESRVRDGPTELNMVMWMGRTALELIGQAGLGASFDRLVEDTEDEYAEAIKGIIPALAAVGPFVQFLPLCETFVPEQWMRPIANRLPINGLKDVLRYSDVMRSRAKKIIEQRKEALASGDEALKLQVGEGKDIMSILLRANMTASEEDRLPEDELEGQVTTLTFAAMDTTSNALSLTLWRLAQNLDIQGRLRREIHEAREVHGEDVPYDELISLPFLDAIVRETLRVHVPAPLRLRIATQDVILPLHQPIRGADGMLTHEIMVPKGTTAFASISSSNITPSIWGEDGYEWKPERWLKPLPDTVKDAKMPGIYSNLMTFWAGSRACIGFKFSQLEMKVVLAMLIANFKFELTEKQIYWNIAGVTFPSTVPSGNQPELPMKITSLSNGGSGA